MEFFLGKWQNRQKAKLNALLGKMYVNNIDVYMMYVPYCMYNLSIYFNKTSHL